MARVSALEFEKVLKILDALAKAGFTAEMGEEVCKRPVLASVMVEALKKHSRTSLIHGAFNTTPDVLSAFMARCTEEEIDFTKFFWTGSHVPPEFEANDPNVVVVLDASLDSLERTFAFAWEWAASRQERAFHWEQGVRFDREHLALLEGISFKPWTLQWRRIKLDAHLGKRPVDVRSPQNSPACALLFLAAEHPERVRDVEKRSGFFLPGLTCTVAGEEKDAPWESVPAISFYEAHQGIELAYRYLDEACEGFTVPVFIDV